MWLKLLVVVALTFVGATTAFTDSTEENSGIEFHTGSWDDALSRARKENKLIFLDISASWCGPCKLLKKKTFPEQEVGRYYNANFINVAMDGEVGEGAELAKRYAVRGYPTLLFIDGNGNLVAQTTGYRNPENFLKLGQTVVEGHGRVKKEK